MSVSKWAYTPWKCDGQPCPGDCDHCPKAYEDESDKPTDLISRADAIDALSRSSVYAWSIEQDLVAHSWAIRILQSLPSADAVSREDGDMLLVDLNAENGYLLDGKYKVNGCKDLTDKPQGEWIMHGEPPWLVRECSECGTKWHQWSGDSNPNYCGHCGARMKGGAE